MAWDDDYQNGYDTPREWSDAEADLYDRLFEGQENKNDIASDDFLQTLFDEAWFGDIHGHGGPEHDFLVDQLRDYLDKTYDIDFDDVFDYEAWREWYEGG